MTYELEDDVPLPPKAAQERYPWSQMEVGQSFMVESDDPKKAMERVRGAASNRARKHGETFALRTVEGGVRVWRIG